MNEINARVWWAYRRRSFDILSERALERDEQIPRCANVFCATGFDCVSEYTYRNGQHQFYFVAFSFSVAAAVAAGANEQ